MPYASVDALTARPLTARSPLGSVQGQVPIQVRPSHGLHLRATPELTPCNNAMHGGRTSRQDRTWKKRQTYIYVRNPGLEPFKPQSPP